MKKFLILSLFSTQLCASDLVFKSGFQATALVSGIVSGLQNTGLALELTVNNSPEQLNINADSSFVFTTEVPIGDNWSVTMISLPSSPQQQSCIITNTSGIMPPSGASTLQVTCDNTPWNWDQMNWNEGGWQ